MSEDLFEQMESNGGSEGFAILEVPEGVEVSVPGAVEVSKLFAGMRAIISRVETREDSPLKARRVVLIRLFRAVKA